jgi:carboxyl-terminal processing protease
MRKSLALWSLLGIVTASPFAFSAEKKTPEEYWAGTGLSTSLTLREMKLLEPATCYKSLAGFRGCLAGVNALAARLEPRARYVPNVIAEDASFNFGAPLKRAVGLSLVKVPEAKTEDGNFRAVWAKEEEKRQKEDAAIKGLFEFRQNASIDFIALANDLLPQAVKDKKADALAASEIIGAFLKEAVDAHAHIEPSEEMQDSMNDADQSFAGAGILLQVLGGKILVGSLVEGGPAEKAGVRANDQILSIDGATTTGMKTDKVVSLVRGPVGSTVKLRLLREGKELELAVVRDTVKQENLEAKVVSDLGRKIGVIRLRSFVDKSACGKMGQKILSMETNDHVEGFVLDLRGNGGGLIDQAVCMGGIFFGKKVVVKVRDLQGGQFTELFGSLPAATNLPMVTLIDAGSASASEILSGALQDHERSWVLGERSFGKGSVQAPSPFLGNDRIMFYQTIQRFYQPKGRTNQIVGIEPNFVRPIKPNATDDERFALREKDYYPNALGAENAPWVETRTAKVSKIEACVNGAKLAEKKFAELSASGKAADYQLLSAQEVLGCDK